MTTQSTESNELPSWFSILVFLILVAILIVFGDLFVKIVGIIGVVIAFAANYVDKDGHH